MGNSGAGNRTLCGSTRLRGLWLEDFGDLRRIWRWARRDNAQHKDDWNLNDRRHCGSRDPLCDVRVGGAAESERRKCPGDDQRIGEGQQQQNARRLSVHDNESQRHDVEPRVIGGPADALRSKAKQLNNRERYDMLAEKRAERPERIGQPPDLSLESERRYHDRATSERLRDRPRIAAVRKAA